MRKVILFVEDFAHEVFLRALLQRLRTQHDVPLEVQPRSVRGGHGKTLTELKRYVRDLTRGSEPMPDLLVVGRDANCQGYMDRKREIDAIVTSLADRIICAIPDPHIERWLLPDSAAFKAVLGKGCKLPDHKCERDRYKNLLMQAVQATGITPLLGGIEHTESIVQVMDLQRLGRTDDSLGKLLEALQVKFTAWTQE